ncbi:hypothetical protein [uncultured Clostridium sp.]|uniref:ADP-ribosyltransferase-containing protein n=1 Tax=uncultured Clostridium sp. TaxID=59620 RepID=UPI0026192CC8|nr:hypothetical protein [uncultured Clostridium sp.]
MRFLKENLETDNEGHELSPEQISYFKNSKARNKDGELLVCYHGTPNPGFTEFDPRKAKSQFGNYKFDKYNVNYFTTSLETAEGYTEIGLGDVDGERKNIYACYLNIENPYIVDNHSTAEIKNFKNIKDKKIREVELKAFEKLMDLFE